MGLTDEFLLPLIKAKNGSQSRRIMEPNETSSAGSEGGRLTTLLQRTVLPKTTTPASVLPSTSSSIIGSIKAASNKAVEKMQQIMAGNTDDAGHPPTVTHGHCSQPFAFECDFENCCEQYQWQIYVLLVALAFIALALVVFVIYFIRSKTKRNSTAATLQHISSGEHEREEHDKLVKDKTKEETQYLRRMSMMHQYPVRPDEK